MSGRRFRSRFSTALSLEEKLEVDKVYARSQDDGDTGLFDNLYQGVQTQIDLEKAKEEKESNDESPEESTPDDSEGSIDESTAPDESNDSNPEDDGSLSKEPESDTPKESEDKKDDDKPADDTSDTEKDTKEGSDQKDETKEALESLFNDHNVALETYLALESDYYDNSLYSGGFKNTVASGAKYLAEIGFKYGPVLLKHVYKGVLIALNVTFKALVKSTVFIAGMIKRHMNSYRHHKNSIYELRKTIELIESNSVEAPEDDEQYSKEAVINRLKAGSSIDIMKLCQLALDFNTAFFKQFEQSANMNLVATDNLIHSAMSKNVKAPYSHMQDGFPLPGFKQQTIPGYELESDYLDTYVYQRVLPGDFLFLGYLPKPSVRNRNEIFEAYKDAELFVGINQTHNTRVEHIDYMEIDEIKKYLDSLETLCDIGISQEKILHGIISKKKALKLRLEAYLKYLAVSQSKVSIEDSLAEYISLKIRYFDKTLVHGCDAVHEYTTNYISASLTYIAACLKRYS